MDPNQTLADLNVARDAGLSKAAVDARLSLSGALYNWLQSGGFEPDWEKFPRATAYFVVWQINVIF